MSSRILTRRLGIAVVAVITIVIIIMVVMVGWQTVPVGTRGVLLNFGKADPMPLSPGLHLITPFFQNIETMNTQTQISTTTADAASSDLQDVSTTIAINWHISPADTVTIYSNLGQAYADKVIAPAVQETVKQVAAKFSAAELITQRPIAKNEITSLITTRLANYGIQVEAVSITDFKFSDSFTQAIEAKVTAAQNADRAYNQVLTAKFEAEQAVQTANGTATSIKIIQDQLNKSPQYIHYLIASKWNGMLPTVVGSGGIPLLNIPIGNQTK
jgi:prohibitin 2